MLITLVIIGIVAALTIPNLMQKYTEQTTVKKVQKFYTTLSNAFSQAIKENGPVNEWGVTGMNSESAIKIYEVLFKPYFKIAKDCGLNNNGKCVYQGSYKKIGNEYTHAYGGDTNFYKVTLEDGAAIWCSGDSEGNIIVSYDVNGAKAPNQWGRDVFALRSTKDMIFPEGSPEQRGRHVFKYTCNTSSNAGVAGMHCAAWVIYKGNMDYLHCDGLDWDKNSCKDK